MTKTKEDKIIAPPKTITIHNNEYVPVAERIRYGHELEEIVSITTEIMEHPTLVLFKATVVTSKGTFNAHSAANPAKAIEKQSPYEVAETSAVGRALAFAGIGIVEGVASADEVNKGGYDAEPEMLSEKQDKLIRDLLGDNVDMFEEAKGPISGLTKAKAVGVIKQLMEKPKAPVEQPVLVEEEIDLSTLPF